MTYMPAIIERLDKIESMFGGGVFNPMESKAQEVPGAE